MTKLPERWPGSVAAQQLFGYIVAGLESAINFVRKTVDKGQSLIVIL